MKIKSVIVTVLFLALFGTMFSQENSNSKNLYEVIYEADKDGNRISGNLDDLIKYVQNGNPIRVGWEFPPLFFPSDDKKYTLEHWADGNFVSIYNGQVFAQIQSIYGQGIVVPSEDRKPQIDLQSNSPDAWVALISTTGVFKQKMKRDEMMVEFLKSEGKTEEEVEKELKEMETSNFKTKWAVMKTN